MILTATTTESPESMETYLHRLLAGPADPSRDFTIGQRDYGAVYAMAHGIRRELPKTGAVCLLCDDPAVAAAAFLAALAGGVPLVIPYAVSRRAAEDIHREIRLSAVVAEDRERVPAGVQAIVPSTGTLSPESISGMTPGIGPDTPFLHFFTGGSTGRPQMWTKTARNLLAEARFQTRFHGIAPTDRVLATVPPHHIYGFLFSVLAPFVASASVVPEVFVFPEEIRKAMVHFRPTIHVSVPMHYHILNGGPIPSETLRMAFSSAGRLAPDDADYFHGQTGVPLVEIYGSTETGGLAWRCRARGETELTPFEIVDWKIEEELLLVNSPFVGPDAPRDGDGFFRTGDRIRALPDGRWSLLGRADGIVKVGGKRVDLHRIEEALKGMDGVADAVAISLAAEGGREAEVFALVQGDADPSALRVALSEILEPHATPRRLRVVERIPVTPSGKYDRRGIEGMFGEVDRSKDLTGKA
jgi:acyl-coenzyme A synthetase/AMP-(fatty) acid ligase